MRHEIINGLGHPYFCSMFGITKRMYKCNMWLEIFDKVGGIGFLAYADKKPVAQMIFVPKNFARKICLPTRQCNVNLETTIVIGCLFTIQEYSNKGIASTMIRSLINFCKKHGYSAIESCVDPRPPDQAKINTSYFPFRKFGFIIDGTREGFEFRPETRMCYLKLP